MSKFTVLYLILTDAQRADINTRGWVDSEVGSAYLEAQYKSNINDAIEKNLYKQATIIDNDDFDLEDIFTAMQNINRSWTETFVAITDYPRSMMIGDIIYDHDKNKFFIVAHVGFDLVETNIEKLSELVN